MIEKVAVGTDGSETANKAVDFAFDVAEKFGATVVICSSYRPVSEDKVRREQREAPEDIQWSINPTQEVDSTLNTAAERARGRGHRDRHRGPRGRPGRRALRHRRGPRRRPAGGREQGHAAARARQRPEQRLAQGSLLGGDRQDDVTCRADGRHGRAAARAPTKPSTGATSTARWRCSTRTRSGSSTPSCRRPAATEGRDTIRALPRAVPRLVGRLRAADRGGARRGGMRAAVHPPHARAAGAAASTCSHATRTCG